MNKKLLAILSVVALGFAGNAMAGTTASHDVTLTVSAINEVAVSGGNITLTINTATAGLDPDAQTDATTADLDWTTNEATKKITVASDAAVSAATLKVVAANVSGGTAASQVTLSTTPADFVTAISTTTGGCDLSYEASATAAQGTSSNTYTITYTITAG